MINKKDIQTLVDCEDYLYKMLVADKKKDGEMIDYDDEEYDLFCRYNTLVEKIIQSHEGILKANRKRITEKRKTNKYYARSQKEIERMKRNEG